MGTPVETQAQEGATRAQHGADVTLGRVMGALRRNVEAGDGEAVTLRMTTRRATLSFEQDGGGEGEGDACSDDDEDMPLLQSPQVARLGKCGATAPPLFSDDPPSCHQTFNVKVDNVCITAFTERPRRTIVKVSVAAGPLAGVFMAHTVWESEIDAAMECRRSTLTPGTHSIMLCGRATGGVGETRALASVAREDAGRGGGGGEGRALALRAQRRKLHAAQAHTLPLPPRGGRGLRRPVVVHPVRRCGRGRARLCGAGPRRRRRHGSEKGVAGAADGDGARGRAALVERKDADGEA